MMQVNSVISLIEILRLHARRFVKVLLLGLSYSVAVHAAIYDVAWGASGLSVSPPTLQIAVGDTVTWSGSMSSHPLNQTTANFTSVIAPLASSGISFVKSFPSAGTFYFQCAFHSSMTVVVTVGSGVACSVAPGPLAILDIDGNGTVDAATDGLLILRYLLGMRGDTLITGALGANPSRCDAPSIEAHLALRITP
jgi:plastocyanin